MHKHMLAGLVTAGFGNGKSISRDPEKGKPRGDRRPLKHPQTERHEN